MVIWECALILVVLFQMIHFWSQALYTGKANRNSQTVVIEWCFIKGEEELSEVLLGSRRQKKTG